MEFVPHTDKQDQALFSESPIVVCATGIQWGKTRVGAMKTKMAMHTFRGKSDNFLILAPTYKIMQQSTLPAFLQLMDGYGKYSAGAAEFKVNGGGTGYFRTATDPDSIVGVTDVRFIWGDEAGKYSLYFWENIQARAGFREAQICLTTSPYTLNWIFKEIIRPKQKNALAREDCDLIQAASWENPFFPAATIDRARKTMDSRRFNMLFGGAWEKMEGLVYDCFDETENQCEMFPLPTGSRTFAGVDWGYTEPFVLVVHAILPSGRRIQLSETYKSGLTIPDIVSIAKQKRDVFGIEKFYCDPSQPGYIEELCRNGVPAVAANNDIRPGIDWVYELIKTREFKMVRGSSPHTIDEIETYHYPEPADLKPDQKAKEQNPVGQNDHACLAGHTLMETTDGPKMIADVKAGDLIKTPAGFKKVIDIWEVGVRETLRLEADGRAIEATPDHPFYSPFQGFIRLDALRYCANVPRWTLFTLMVKSIVGTASILARLAAVLMVAKECMWRYGNIGLAQCQRAFMFITKIMTAETMMLPTSLCFQSQSTPSITAKTRAHQERKLTSIALGIWRQSGTDPMRAGHGTEIMPKIGSANQSQKSVNIVINTMKHRKIDPAFARTIVSLAFDVNQVWTTSKRLALSAISRLLKINIQGSPLVQSHAQLSCSGKQKVFDLTVEGVGCFYANGFLVSNCDAIRYVSVMTKHIGVGGKTAPKTPEDNKPKDQYARLKELRKNKKHGPGTESWS